jgi:hypothetical protein
MCKFTRVESLWVNGESTDRLAFTLEGPVGDKHSGYTRKLDGHDSRFRALSGFKKGHIVFNYRSWSGISLQEINKIEKKLGIKIPGGCLLENLVISGIRNFSQLPSGSQLVFPAKPDGSQVILAIWRRNTPCHIVGMRLQSHYPENPHLSKHFIKVAVKSRGVVGFVISGGYIDVGDTVEVYPPDI